MRSHFFIMRIVMFCLLSAAVCHFAGCGYRLAGSEAEADARLTGVVVSRATDTITHRDRYASDEMRVRAVLDVQLVSRGGDVLWSARGVAGRETYEVAGAAAYLTEESKKAAIMRLSEKMAETIYNRMTADF